MAMIRMSNNVIGAANLVTLLLSVPFLAAGVWMRTRADGTGCDHFLSTPALALGAALAAVSLAGLLGACCHATWLIWVYLLAAFALIVALLCFTAFAFAFAFAVTSRAAGDGAAAAPGGGFRVHRLGDYSTWRRRHVEGGKNWARIRSCLADAGVCKRLEEEDGNKTKAATTLAQLLGGGGGSGLSPVESGCCKPPASCNFTYAGGTEWTRTKPAAPSADPDCGRWDNDDDKLCYGCDSCKAGVEGALRRDWRRAAVVDAVFLVVIVIVYSAACCAFRNSRRDNYAYRRSRAWKPNDTPNQSP